jgi:hypothetical protein
VFTGNFLLSLRGNTACLCRNFPVLGGGFRGSHCGTFCLTGIFQPFFRSVPTAHGNFHIATRGILTSVGTCLILERGTTLRQVSGSRSMGLLMLAYFTVTFLQFANLLLLLFTQFTV